jgi:YebC/PmpR family DNA-binding regulatory protein
MGRGWINTIKAANAAKKGALFTKIVRELQVAAKMGGPDPTMNARLRMALDNARKSSVPAETVDRAIKKGAGLLEGTQIDEITYEGFGPHGIAVIVETQTDNRTRTVSELRSLFKDHSGALGETGSVVWMFERVGWIEGTKVGQFDPDEEAIEAGAQEVFEQRTSPDEAQSRVFCFLTTSDSLDQVKQVLQGRGWQLTKAHLGYNPKNLIELDELQRKEVYDFFSELEDFDDTHRFYHNLKM